MTARDASRAIVIDFEGSKGDRPHPDLIGIHDPFEAPESRFYQVVLVPRLAPAAKAGKGHAVEERAEAGGDEVGGSRSGEKQEEERDSHCRPHRCPVKSRPHARALQRK